MGQAVDDLTFLEVQAHCSGVRFNRFEPLFPEQVSGDDGDLAVSLQLLLLLVFGNVESELSFTSVFVGLNDETQPTYYRQLLGVD